MKIGMASTLGVELGLTGPNTGTYNGYFIYSEFLNSNSMFNNFELQFSHSVFQNGATNVDVRLVTHLFCPLRQSTR